MEGWIKLHRQIIDSPVFAHPIALKIWIWFLCRASHRNRTIQLRTGPGYTSVDLTYGQFVFGRHQAEEDLGIDGSTIYKWLKKFENELQMIKVESNNMFSVVTILKFSEYQSDETDDCSSQVAANEQPNSSQVTTNEQPSNTNKNLNNVNTVNKDTSVGTTPPAPPQTLDQRKKELADKLIPFVDRYGKDMIRQFYDYWTEKGDKHKKMRFEKEKVFEVEKRLVTWKLRDGKFNRTNGHVYQPGKFVQ